MPNTITAPATPYRFMVRIVANAKCEILARTPEAAMARDLEPEFATYEEALAVVHAGQKTAWSVTTEWRGDPSVFGDLECVITGVVRKRIKYFEIYATDAERFHVGNTKLVSLHTRRPDGVDTTVVTDPSTLVKDAPAVEVTADPVTVAAAGAPVCEDPELVRFDVSKTTPVKTRAGRTLHSHFTCGAWALGNRVDGLVRDLARDRATLARLQRDPRRAWRRERLAASIAEGEKHAIRLVSHWLVDPPVCTCRERVRVLCEA